MADGGAGAKPGRRSPAPVRWARGQARRFLEHLAESSNVAEAARVAGLTTSQVYYRKRRDPAFAADWAQALETGFSELELLLLRHSLHGSERLEVVTDGATGTVKQVKKVRSHPLALALRLHLLHREEVLRNRATDAAASRTESEEEVIARVRAAMAEVRARLAAATLADRQDEGDD